MIKINNSNSERKKLLKKARDTISDVREIVTKVQKIDNIKGKEAVNILLDLRDKCYENLNQIPHDLMILQAAKWIEKRCHPDKAIEWHCNPRQTSKKGRPTYMAKSLGRL
jgi:hypothetical protein